MGDFLNDTNLSELECAAPQATSTVLPESRRARSIHPKVTGLARILFEDTASEESLRLLKGSFLDANLLSHSFEQSGRTGASVMEDHDAVGDRGASNSYLRERFDLSESDMHLQEPLEHEENFTAAGAAVLAEDEKRFKEENFLKIPQQCSFSDSKCSASLDGIETSDLSQPSWWPEDTGDGRITISAYLRSRSAPMEGVLEYSPLFRSLAKADENEVSTTGSTSVTNSIQNLVNEGLGLKKKSPCNEQQTDEPQRSIVVYKPSVSEINKALEDVSLSDSSKLAEKLIGAARRRAKGPTQQHPSCNNSKVQQQDDGCFKRPLAAAPRTRPSQQLTPTTSTLCTDFSGKVSTSASPSTSSSRIPSSHSARKPSPRKPSPRKYRARLPGHHKVATSSHAPNQATSMMSMQKSRQKTPISPHHRPRAVHQDVECLYGVCTEMQAGSHVSRLLSISSPDLRPSKSLGNDQQSVARLNLCKSDESLAIPERDTVAGVEKDSVSRNTGPAGQSRGTSHCGSSGTSTGKFLTASSFKHSPTHPLPNLEGHSRPAPLGLLLPMGFFQCPSVNLGKVCAGVQQAVTITLMNPTVKTECYELYQSSIRIGEQTPGQHETVAAEFPHRHIVCAGCVSDVQGFFVSTCPGVVEIDVVIAVEDKTGNLTKDVHRLTLSAQVECPQIKLEPSQGLNFEGLHFDAEHGDSSTCSKELTVVNESACPVPVSIFVRRGNGVFSLRLKDTTTHNLGEAASMLHAVLPSKTRQTATCILVECSTKTAECLVIDAEIEIEVNGCLLFRKVLAAVGLSASIVAPSVRLEGIGSDELIEVGDGKGQATVLLLENDGPCSLELELSTGPLFRVSPRNARIQAKGSVELFIRAVQSAGCPAVPDSTTSASILEAVLVPQGFRVALCRLVGPSQHHMNRDTTASVASSQSGCSGSSDRFVRTLESNRRVLLWVGMHASSSESKCLIIRNPNSSPINVELELAGQYSKHFRARVVKAKDTKGASASTQLEATGSVEVKVTHSSRASLATGQTAERVVAPTFVHSKLIIKTRCGRTADTKGVALYAFSGRLQVDILDTLALGPHRHLVDIGPLLSEGMKASKEITVSNSGNWDACIYFAKPGSVFVSNSPETTEGVGCGELLVSPSGMVLRPKQTKVVTVTYRFGASSTQLPGDDQIKVVANMRVLHGFEALRQAAKRSFAKAGGNCQTSKELEPFLASFEDEGQTDAIPVSGNLAEEVFLRTVWQAAVAVIVNTGGAATLLQASSSAYSFAPLEDPSLLSRLSWLDTPK